jgi:hypothetical protein
MAARRELVRKFWAFEKQLLLNQDYQSGSQEKQEITQT